MTTIELPSDLQISKDSGTLTYPWHQFFDQLVGQTDLNINPTTGIIVYPEQFGAVRDGVTDDTAAFAAAIASLTHGGIIFLSPGTYLVSNITLALGITLQGSGWGRDEGESVTVIKGSADDNVIYINSVGCNVRDLCVSTSLAAGVSTHAGIKIGTGTQLNTIERVLVTGHKYGVWIQQGRVTLNYVNAQSNSSHGFFFDSLVGVGMGEYRILYCIAVSNGGDGFQFSGSSTAQNAGIYFLSPSSAFNAGNGYTFQSFGPFGVVDVYMSQVIASLNTGNGIDMGSLVTGVNFVINDGLIESDGTGAIGIAVGINTYEVVLSGLNIAGFVTGISLLGNGGTVSDITFSNNDNNIELGATSSSYSLSNINGSTIQGGSTIGLVIDVGAGAFVATGVDLTYAATVLAGTVPAGSRMVACLGLHDILKNYTVATLPTGVRGGIAFATNCRAFNGAGVQEGAGVGTGSLVTYNGTAWKIAGTNVTAIA